MASCARVHVHAIATASLLAIMYSAHKRGWVGGGEEGVVVSEAVVFFVIAFVVVVTGSHPTGLARGGGREGGARTWHERTRLDCRQRSRAG